MRTLGLGLVVLVASACTLLDRGPGPSLVGCPMAQLEGTLVGQTPNYLSLVTSEGETIDVDWSESLAINPGDPIELVDSNGVVVARAGDRVVITGGALHGIGTWTECGGVQVKPAST